MPPIALLILQAFEAAITEAPAAIALVHRAEDYFRAMFSAGLITKEQQDALQNRIYAVRDAFANGQRPPEFAVEPTPSAPTSSTSAPNAPTNVGSVLSEVTQVLGEAVQVAASIAPTAAPQNGA